MTQTVVIHGDRQRRIAAEIIAMAPKGAVVTVKAASRTLDQNALLWAVLSDISRAKPEGRRWTPETWKCAFMHTLGHQVQFCEGLDDSGPFPLGFRSSRLTVGQMADLLTVALEYGDRHGVAWSDEARDER
ncbi:MAG: recombination protein NinB [Paracoccaceae bacterium]